MTELTVGNSTYTQIEPEASSVTYPEWQKTIREAQTEANAKKQQEAAKEKEERDARNMQRLSRLIDILQKCGIAVTFGEVNIQHQAYDYIDNVEITRSAGANDYTFGIRTGQTGEMFFARVEVDGATDELLTEHWDDGYRRYAIEEDRPGNVTPAKLAEMIDCADLSAEDARRRNLKIIARNEVQQVPPVQVILPKLQPIALEEFNRFSEMKPWVLEHASKGYVLKSHTVHVDDQIVVHTVIMELAGVQS